MSELLSAGIELMLLGMATVFVFLTLLVIGTHLMSFILNTMVSPEVDASKPVLPNNDEQEIVAIAAAAMAVHQAS